MPYTTLPDPVLALSLANVNKLNDLDLDQLAGLWNVFTKCGESLESGRRLENLSWRLWFREAHLLPPDASSDFELSNSTDCTSTPLEGSTPIGTPRTSRSASLNLVAAGINAAFAPNSRHNNSNINSSTRTRQNNLHSHSQDLSDPESGNWSSEESVGEYCEEVEVEEGQSRKEDNKSSESSSGKEVLLSTAKTSQKSKLERASSERSRGRSASTKKRVTSGHHHHAHRANPQEGSNSAGSASRSHSRTSSSSSAKDLGGSDSAKNEDRRSSIRPKYPKHASFDVGPRENNASPNEESSMNNDNMKQSTSGDFDSHPSAPKSRSSRPLSSASAFGSRARVRQRNQSLSAGGGGSAAAVRRRRPLSFSEAVESLALGLDGVGSNIGGGRSSTSVNTYQGPNGKGKERGRSSLGLGYTLNTSASHPALGKTDGMTTTYESDAEDQEHKQFFPRQDATQSQDEKERIERAKMPPPPLPLQSKASASTSKADTSKDDASSHPSSSVTTSNTQLQDSASQTEKGKGTSKFFVGSYTSHASMDSAEVDASPAQSPALPQQESDAADQPLQPQDEPPSSQVLTHPHETNLSSVINRPSSRRTPSDASSATSERANSDLSKKRNQSQSNLASRRSKSGTALHRSSHTASAHGRKASGGAGARHPGFLRGLTGLTAMTKTEKSAEPDQRRVDPASKLKGLEKGSNNHQRVSDNVEIPEQAPAAKVSNPAIPALASTSTASQQASAVASKPSEAALPKDDLKTAVKKPVKFTMGCGDESEEEWSEDEEVPNQQKQDGATRSGDFREEQERSKLSEREQEAPRPNTAAPSTSLRENPAQPQAADNGEEDEEEVEGEDDSDWSSDEPTAEELQAEKEAASAQRRAEEEARQREMFQKRPIRSASATDVRKFGTALAMSGMNPSKSSTVSHPHPNPSPPAQPVRGFLSSLFHPEQADHPPPGQLAGRPHASAANLRTGISTAHPSQQAAAAGGSGLSKLDEIDENDPHHKQRQRNRMIRESHHQREKLNKRGRDEAQPSTSYTARALGGGGGLRTSKSGVALPVLNTVASSTSIHGMDQMGGHSLEAKPPVTSHSRSRSKDREDDRRDGRSTFSRRFSGDAKPQPQRSNSGSNVNLENDEDDEGSEDEVPQPSSLALARLSQFAKKKATGNSSNDLKSLLPVGGSTATAKARKRNSVSTNGSGSNVSADSSLQQSQQQSQLQPPPREVFRYTNETMFKNRPGEIVGAAANQKHNPPANSSLLAPQAVSSLRAPSDQDMSNLAQPQTPRTTRRNMLRDELSESLRQNLLWERQSRNRMLGIGAIGNQGGTNVAQQQQQLPDQPRMAQQQQDQLNRSSSQSVLSGNLRPLTPSTTSSTTKPNNTQHRRDGSSSNLKRNQSTDGGFHHSGW